MTSSTARDQSETACAIGEPNARRVTTRAVTACARRTRRAARGTTRPERCSTHPAGSLSTPSYTAQMGHWSESLVEEVAALVGKDPDRERIRRLLDETGNEIEILAGRTFGGGGRKSIGIEWAGLPFTDVPDLHRGTLESRDAFHEVPDPANKQMTTVLQVSQPMRPLRHAISVADALFAAGQIIADVSRDGRLAGDYVVRWLGHSMDAEDRKALLRRVMDPSHRFNVPILGVELGGWWFQISRRLIWVTNETENEGRLLEPLFDVAEISDGRAAPLCASEAVLIAARLTSQPIEWAFSARIWTDDVKRPYRRPWRILAKAIHGFGIPVIAVDRTSTRMEIACQVLLKAYWHGYIGNDEPGLATAVARAYPKQVDRVRRGTGAPDAQSAAATLLAGLLHPGFDPARGAESNRRYVTRKASIAVMEHRKREAVDDQPWTRIGISERRYYKLLPRFARKVNGRYEVDRADIVERVKTYLDATEHDRTVRSLALEVLQRHGFSNAAARKWLQRHPPEEAVNARARRSAA